MSLDLALTIARSGLAAVQRSLNQASQNVANASTDGYTRKTLAQTALTVGDQPAGLRSSEAQRAVDAALVARIQTATAGVAASTARERLLSGIEQAHGAVGAGDTLADSVAALQSGLLTLRATPADAGEQRATLDAATTVAARLNEVSGAIGTARQQAQDGLVDEVANANAALREIAALTLRIRIGIEGDTAALEDQRDAAVSRLAESIEVQAVRRLGGDMVIIARGGIVLPLDPDRDVLGVERAMVTPEAYYGAGGTLPGVTLNGIDVTSQVSGGRMGEYLALRDRTLPRLQAETDLVAANIAGRLAAQGLTLFTDRDDGSVPDTGAAYAGSSQLGFAGRIQVNPAITLNPSLLRNGTDAISGSPAGASDFTPNPPDGPAGFTTLLDRVLTFSFGPNAAAGVAWSAIATGGLGPDGSLASPFSAPPTLAGYAERVTTAQTAERAAATDSRNSSEALRAALRTRFDNASGVDVDAEMSAMVQLQNAYAANARVMGTLQSMWDSLLGAVR